MCIRDSIDFKDQRNRKLYRIGRGEQGVLLVRPYTNDICAHWRFKTPEIAVKSSNKIFAMYLDYRDEEDFIGMDMCRKFLEMGFTAIKQDPVGPYSFQGGRELSLAELSRAEYSVRRIREAVGDRADILLGTHGQMTTASAIRLARRIEPFDPLWFEEPCPPDQIDGLKAVATSTSIPIAAGERLTTRKEFHEALRAGVRILQPNVGRSGGLWETKKIAALAELFNAQVAPHIYCGPVAHAAATHLGFTLPNFLILETILSDFHQQVVASPLDWESGWMLPPREPGLGVHLNHDVLANHPYTTGGRLHLEMTQTPLDSNNSRLASELD